MDRERGDSRSVVEACCWSHLLLSTLIACSFYSRLSLPFAVGGFISILSAPRRAVEIMNSFPLPLRADGADRSIADASSAAVGSTQRRSRERAHLVLGMGVVGANSRLRYRRRVSVDFWIWLGNSSGKHFLVMVLASSREKPIFDVRA